MKPELPEAERAKKIQATLKALFYKEITKKSDEALERSLQTYPNFSRDFKTINEKENWYTYVMYHFSTN